MRGARSDFDIFADNEDTSKSSKRPGRSRKDGSKSKSPPTETRSVTRGTANPKKTVTETVPKPALKVLGNNNKENVDPLLGKPAGKKRNETTATQNIPKMNNALQSPPNKVSTALNNKNRNIPQGKSLKQVRIKDKAAGSNTPKSKQTLETSTLPFSPLADITEAYNSKCPTPLPLSVSFSATSTVIVERRSEQASVTDQISETAVSKLHAEPRIPSSEKCNTLELGKVNMRREDISPNKVLKVDELNPASHPVNHIDNNHDITDAKERAATKNVPKKNDASKIEVDRSSSPSVMSPILPDSSDSSIIENQPFEILKVSGGSGKTTPIQNNRSTEGENCKPKEELHEIKASVNKLKRKALDVSEDECPNKRKRDENYIACTDLLEIKLGADRAAKTTIEVVPADKPFFKQIIMDFAPGF